MSWFCSEGLTLWPQCLILVASAHDAVIGAFVLFALQVGTVTPVDDFKAILADKEKDRFEEGLCWLHSHKAL